METALIIFGPALLAVGSFAAGWAMGRSNRRTEI